MMKCAEGALSQTSEMELNSVSQVVEFNGYSFIFPLESFFSPVPHRKYDNDRGALMK